MMKEGSNRDMTGDKNTAADSFLIVCMEQEGDSQDGYLIGLCDEAGSNRGHPVLAPLSFSLSSLPLVFSQP